MEFLNYFPRMMWQDLGAKFTDIEYKGNLCTIKYVLCHGYEPTICTVFDEKKTVFAYH